MAERQCHPMECRSLWAPFELWSRPYNCCCCCKLMWHIHMCMHASIKEYAKIVRMAFKKMEKKSNRTRTKGHNAHKMARADNEWQALCATPADRLTSSFGPAPVREIKLREILNYAF